MSKNNCKQNKTQSVGIVNTHVYKLKLKIYGIIKLVVFLSLLFACFFIVNNVVKRKESYEKTADFFNQKENFDVLFFGSSHMHNGVFPMQLWDEYGIISYNLGNDGERLATTYHNILLALRENKPKLIVIDSFFIFNNEKVSPKSVETHKMLDAYPISYEKYLAIRDLFGNDKILNNMFEYLFNFSIYHSRWNELRKVDFESGKLYEKGAESMINVAIPGNVNSFENVDIYTNEETINIQYRRKIIKYCKENDIEIVITYLPFPAKDFDISLSKYVDKICSELNINSINFLNMDVVNYNTDCYDDGAHLNPSGARKVTNYIGKYIKENYDLPDQRENNIYDFWNKDYDEYIDFKISNLAKNKTNLNNYLMLLYGESDISYDIKVSSKIQIEKGSTLQKLLENLNNNYEIDDDEFINDINKTIKITTKDNRSGKEIDTIWF